MFSLSKNEDLQALIALSIHRQIQGAFRKMTEIEDLEEAKDLLGQLINRVAEAELLKEPLFRAGDSAAWHLAWTNLKAACGMRKMVGVPGR